MTIEFRLPSILQGASGVGGYSNNDPGKVQRRVDVWRAGVDLGLNALDTADSYGGGFSEELVGTAIRGIRDRVILATKFNPPQENPAHGIQDSLERSLRRLKTDYIDLYQIHYPNPLVRIEDILEPLVKAAGAGKIRHVGLSNFSISEAIEAKRLCPELIVSNQVEFNLAVRPSDEDSVEKHRELGLVFIAYSPLNQGRIFTSRIHREVLGRIAGRYHKSVAQVILRWATSLPGVHTVTKASTLEHLQEIADSQTFMLDDFDLGEINQLPLLGVQMVDPKSVLLEIVSDRPVYSSLDEATSNPLNLEPSPVQIAELIRSRGQARPVELRRLNRSSGAFQYQIDGYDVLGQVRRYWGWVIAHGMNAPMPAFVLEDQY